MTLSILTKRYNRIERMKNVSNHKTNEEPKREQLKTYDADDMTDAEQALALIDRNHQSVQAMKQGKSNKTHDTEWKTKVD